MFLPIKPDFHLPRFPIMTVIVCLICLGVFIKQRSDIYDYGLAMTKFCNASRSHIEQIVFERLGAAQTVEACFDIMHKIANDPERDEDEVIAELASKMRPLTGFNREDSTLYVTRMLEDEVRRYRSQVPGFPGEGLAYYTGSWNPVTMITSSFAHGSWGHVIFNLIGFFAFAATVEMLVGYIWYWVFILVNSWFIGLSGSVLAAAAGQHYSTLGLSGVVMGMMGLFAYLLPKGKIRCYYFFIVIFGSIAIPGWMLATWYIGGEVIALFFREDHGVINVLAHVMGGLSGYLFGVAFLRHVRRDAVHLEGDLERQAFERRFK